MHKPAVIELHEHEEIVGVIQEYCSGPGWTNALTKVFIMGDGKVRLDLIQPNDRTADMHTLFAVGAVCSAALIAAVATRRVK